MNAVNIVALLVACTFAGPVTAGTLTYTIAGAQFQETSREDQSDRLELHVQGTVRSAGFNRSRGVGDVATTVGDKLLFAGELIDLRTGKAEGRVKAPDFWLAPGLAVSSGKQALVMHTARRACMVKLPHGASVPSVAPNSIAWFAAGNERSAVFLATQRAAGSSGDTATSRLLPLHVDLASCKLEIGRPIVSPGFDHRLQSNGHRFWLSSNVESSLAWSQDGLSWHPIALPEATHTLLSAYLAADDAPWVAVSRADKDFALGLYRQDGSGGPWQAVAWDDPAVPPHWLEATREIAAQRALTGATQAPNPASAASP